MITLHGREAEVVSLLCDGYAPREIAAKLGIAHNTAKRHLGHAYIRAGITNDWIKHVRLVYLIHTGEVEIESNERN